MSRVYYNQYQNSKLPPIYKRDADGGLVARICVECKVFKAPEVFVVSRKTTTGLASICKECHNKKCAEIRKTDRHKELRRINRTRDRLAALAARFRGLGVDLTVPQYLHLKESIGGKCGICGIVSKNYGKTFVLDHCHTTKKVRGFLCINCNSGLGMFKDQPRIIKSAIEYLKKHK